MNINIRKYNRKIIGGVFVLLVITGWFFYAYPPKTEEPALVIIEQEGKLVYQGDLQQTETVLVFGGLAGDYEVELSPGRVRMKSAHCPDKLCMHQGWISQAHRPIVCLPQKVIIYIQSAQQAQENLDTFQ